VKDKNENREHRQDMEGNNLFGSVVFSTIGNEKMP
jgi:hypothetical protein